MAHLLVMTTCDSPETAERLAAALLEEKLAACISVLPGATSLYEWHGKVEKEHEHVLFIKTNATRYDALERRLLELHPYELPEVIGVPIQTGLGAYLAWIDEQLP